MGYWNSTDGASTFWCGKLDEFIEHHNDEIEDQDEQIMVICVESADRG